MKKYELLKSEVITTDGNKISLTELLELFNVPKYQVCKYPLIGHVVIQNGKRIEVEREPVQNDFSQIAYEWHVDGDHAGELCRIYIGSKYTRGIYLQYTHHNGTDGTPRWYTGYANGNCGKNYASGGTWSGDSKGFSTLREALDDRFSESITEVGGIKMKDSYYMESRSLGKEIKRQLFALDK